MMDAFDLNAKRQQQQARLASVMVNAISSALEICHPVAAFSYKGGECRAYIDRGITTMDYYTRESGLTWRIRARQGYPGEVALAYTESNQRTNHHDSGLISSALDEMIDARFNGSLRPPSAHFNSIPLKESQVAFERLDNFLGRKGVSDYSVIPISSQDSYTQRVGIRIFRYGTGQEIGVARHLAGREDAILGPILEIPNISSKPIIFYPNRDDSFHQVIDSQSNFETLKEWLREVGLLKQTP